MLKTLSDLLEVAHKLPEEVFYDIEKRITDWMASGGKETDPYIQRQLMYAELWLRRRGEYEGSNSRKVECE